MTNRRDILSMLGLSAGAVALSTDALAVHQDMFPAPPLTATGMGDNAGRKQQENFANALEALAKNVRAGAVNVAGLCVSSELKVDEWVEHNIKLTVEIPCAKPTS